MTDFQEAFAPFVADSRDWYAARVRKHIDKLRDEEGTIRYPGIRRYRDHALALRYLRTSSGRITAGEPMTVTEEFLAKDAQTFGEEQVASFIAKLERKVDGIEVHDVKMHGGGEFTLHGTLAGKPVAINQTCVFKVSNRGKFFLQWPARIYVAGKFITEKAFRGMVEAA